MHFNCKQGLRSPFKHTEVEGDKNVLEGNLIFN